MEEFSKGGKRVLGPRDPNATPWHKTAAAQAKYYEARKVKRRAIAIAAGREPRPQRVHVYKNANLRENQIPWRAAKERMGFGAVPNVAFENFCALHGLESHRQGARLYFELADLERLEAAGIGYDASDCIDAPPESLTEAQRIAFEDRLNEQERRRRLIFAEWRRENGRWVRVRLL